MQDKSSTTTRRELIEKVRDEIGSYSAAQAVVTAYFAEIKKALADDGQVKIHNFGSFEISHKRERMGRNPRNGEKKVITARKVVKFRPCGKLRTCVRGMPGAQDDD